MKYYFVAYWSDVYGSPSSFGQRLLRGKHPLEWQRNQRKYGEITVVSWKEITKEEFEEFVPVCGTEPEMVP